MPHHFRHRDLGENCRRGDGNARYRRKYRIGTDGRDAKAAFDAPEQVLRDIECVLADVRNTDQ